MIGGKPVIQYSLEAFSRSEYVEKVVVVFRDEAQRQAIAETVPDGLASSMLWARGGKERQDSVWAGLQTKIIYSGRKITDDLAAIESHSIPATLIENPTPNPKLTNAEDIAYLEFLRKRFPC